MNMCPTSFNQKERTVDVVRTWKYGGPHILYTIHANEMKLVVCDAYDLEGSVDWKVLGLNFKMVLQFEQIEEAEILQNDNSCSYSFKLKVFPQVSHRGMPCPIINP